MKGLLKDRIKTRSGLKDYDGVLEDYNTIVRLEPYNFNFLRQRLCIRRKLRDFAGALEDCNTLERLQCSSDTVAMYRLQTYSRSGDNYNALAVWIKHWECHLSKNWANISTLHQQIWIKWSNKAKKNLKIDFETKSKQHNYIDIIKICDLLLQLQPDDANSFYCRARSKNLLGDKTGSISDINDFIYMQPSHYAGYHVRGWINSVPGSYEKAIKDYKTALTLKPDDPTLIVDLLKVKLLFESELKAKQDLVAEKEATEESVIT